jgi:hypothetical protein
MPVMRLTHWSPPTDLDPECLALCDAINNHVDGVITTSSCCGHGENPYRIWVHPSSLETLPPLLYWLDRCHTGISGWHMTVSTDCGAGGPFFVIEGPAGAYEEAARIAALLAAEAQESDSE